MKRGHAHPLQGRGGSIDRRGAPTTAPLLTHSPTPFCALKNWTIALSCGSNLCASTLEEHLSAGTKDAFEHVSCRS